MKTYVMINATVYPTDTTDEIKAARAALVDAKIASTPVYAGDPNDPDTYRNGSTLHAWPTEKWSTCPDCEASFHVPPGDPLPPHRAFRSLDRCSGTNKPGKK